MEADTKWFEERGPELICHPPIYLLIADGLPGMWMRPALEREGFRVVESRVVGQEIDVEISADNSDGESTWRLKMYGKEHHCSDIGSLIAQIANSRT